MTPEKILSYEPVVLTEAQRQSYFEKGYLLVERIVPEDWVARLIEITDEMVQRSRSLTESDGIFDLEPGQGCGGSFFDVSYRIDHRADTNQPDLFFITQQIF
ncbi:MAG: hypothetical protein QGI34_04535, partial [Candidatus Latescibacteria bacterium]|nr:hypothetical protein [Candidatus Latescibacterota bacterium]